MPLPVRAASVRTTTSDPKKLPNRPTKTTQAVQATNTSSGGSAASTSRRPSDDISINSSAASAKDSTTASQTSSRLPSPFKRIPSNQSTHTQETLPSQQRTGARGHARQRSAVLLPLSARQKLGHSRSISAVSVNTANIASSHDAPTSRPKLATATTQPSLRSAKAKALPDHKAPTVQQQQHNSRSTQNPQIDLIQNELLQLTIVHEDSKQGLEAYARSIEHALATRQAELATASARVKAKKQSFSSALNLNAIDNWLQQQGYQKACQSMQNLSIATRDLQYLEHIFEGQDGLAAAFELWSTTMSEHLSGRSSDSEYDPTSIHTPFEDQLKPELRRFQQQVDACLATLTTLPECPEESSLSLIMQGHLSLAYTLFSECQTMIQIGGLLVARHHVWIADEVEAAIKELDSSAVDKIGRHAQPAWET